MLYNKKNQLLLLNVKPLIITIQYRYLKKNKLSLYYLRINYI